MLVASHEERRVEAWIAPREGAFRCPECAEPVVLKRGRIRIAHFAHRSRAACRWAAGETLAHLAAKRAIAEALAARGLRAGVECVVPGLAGDRRADVVAWSPTGVRVAIELQHVAIGLDELERRAEAYAAAGVAQMWVPFLRLGLVEGADRPEADGDRRLAAYAARPFERWIDGFNEGGLWYWDPASSALWRGRLVSPGVLGGHRSGPDSGPWSSRRAYELTLWGPFAPADVRLALDRRRAWRRRLYAWPAGRRARFVPRDDSPSPRGRA
jgi:competence protein CoiA